MKECDFLAIAGIVAEFNPFHNGHKYIIDCAKRDGHKVFTVISSNFVQRGETAIISKFDRAKQALLGGADLVCELPCPWSMSTAQNFAFGAVSQLVTLGVEILFFGSESGDTERLVKAAEIIDSAEFQSCIKERINAPVTYAALRQEILSEFDPSLSDILSGPNDTLAVEYISAAKKLGSKLEFKAVKRVGVGHNDTDASGEYANASSIREKIIERDFNYISKYMPYESAEIFLQTDISYMENIEIAVLSRLRTITAEELNRVPDVKEGIENLIISAAREATSLEELYTLIKSKRYTHARIRRIIMAAFIGIDNSFFKTEPPYVRILGFRRNAITLAPNYPRKPIVTKVSQIDSLDEYSQKVFKTECRATDLFSLSFKKPKKSGADMTTPMIKY